MRWFRTGNKAWYPCSRVFFDQKPGKYWAEVWYVDTTYVKSSARWCCSFLCIIATVRKTDRFCPLPIRWLHSQIHHRSSAKDSQTNRTCRGGWWRSRHSHRSLRKGIVPQSFRTQGEGKRRWRVFGGDSLGLIDGGLEVVEMIQPGGSLEAIREKSRPPMPASIHIETTLVTCSCFWYRSLS